MKSQPFGGRTNERVRFNPNQVSQPNPVRLVVWKRTMEAIGPTVRSLVSCVDSWRWMESTSLPTVNGKRNSVLLRTTLLAMLAGLIKTAPDAVAADIEADAWPEFDIWIAVDKARKNRIYILNSYTNEPTYQYDETALGISWDQRFHANWSWRVGARYIWKQVDPPDQNETRVVLDLKWFKDLGGGWLLTDRNRLDLRRFEGDDSSSFRYRNRIQIEKSFQAFHKTMTGFASYEIYYDSRYDKLGQRHRFIGGVSVPIVDWASVDVFYGYHVETKPRDETGAALGIAFGIYFY